MFDKNPSLSLLARSQEDSRRKCVHSANSEEPNYPLKCIVPLFFAFDGSSPWGRNINTFQLYWQKVAQSLFSHQALW